MIISCLLCYRRHLVASFGNIETFDLIESFTDESFGIVTQLIDDVFKICPLAPAIHLGGDEVWHLGSGMRSQDRMERGETKGDLYLKHYSFVIDYILRKYPGNFSRPGFH